MSMRPATFEAFCDLVYTRSGIALGPGKEALVSARVGKRLRALGLTSSEEYLRILRHDPGEELVHFLDAISTNVTSFYRENDHFIFLRQKLLEWKKSGQTRFRCWSCASSTGEEPYSIAMTMAEALGWECDFKILATDISTRALACAMQGEYSSEKMKPVPAPLRDAYFARNGTAWRVEPRLRERVVFRRLNLSEPPFPMHGPLDFVFCRNVMIYFDNTVRSGLLSGIHGLLRHGGYLLVGHTESLTGVSTSFANVKPSVFTKS